MEVIGITNHDEMKKCERCDQPSKMRWRANIYVDGQAEPISKYMCGKCWYESVTCTVKCYCCGFTKVFESAEQAFKEGWDCPPRFSIPACNLCPSSYVYVGVPKKHLEAHERWKVEGRPADFHAVEEKGEV